MSVHSTHNSIQRLVYEHWLFIVLASLITLFWAWGAELVPFHPDESSWLFMSQDFEAWITQPGTLQWQPGASGEREQHYREINAPLAKYILGLSCWLSGTPPHRIDWDWTDTWEGNILTGGMPAPPTLLVGRLAIIFLIPLTLSLIYLAGVQLGSRMAGLCAALFLGMHPLLLLHARRAMAEGPMLFAIALALIGILQGDKRAWLAGLGVALTVNTKQSTLPLLAAGLLGVLWVVPAKGDWWKSAISRTVVYLATFGSLTLLLNPIYWRQPVRAIQAAWQSRAAFTQEVITSFQAYAPEQVIESKPQRTAILLANLYLRPPQFYEIGNYQGEIAPAEQRYLSITGHSWGRGLIPGGIALTLTLLGAALAVVRLRYVSPASKRYLVLMLIITGLEAAGLIFAVPLTFQRYAIPLLPMIAIWIGYALAEMWRIAKPVRKALTVKVAIKKTAHNRS